MEFCHTTTRARTIARRSGPVCAEAGTRSSCRMEKPASLRSESGLGSTPECCSASLWKYRSAPRQLKVASESSATRNRPRFGKIRIDGVAATEPALPPWTQDRSPLGDKEGSASIDRGLPAPQPPTPPPVSAGLARKPECTQETADPSGSPHIGYPPPLYGRPQSPARRGEKRKVCVNRYHLGGDLTGDFQDRESFGFGGHSPVKF